MEGKERQPWHTLLFVVVVLGLFGVLGAVNPKAEWVLSDSLKAAHADVEALGGF